MKLYNTLTRKKEEFTPIDGNQVGLYTCGPTVYNFAHLGNLRAYLFDDILKRTLIFLGYKVKHVMNITDVGHLTSDADAGEDKMQKALKREGLELTVESLLKLADRYTNAFKADLGDLNILEPDIWCKATEHVEAMIEMIRKIEKNGYTYETDLALYFEVAKFKNYSQLSGQKLEEKSIGARDEVEVDPGKRQPADFALWFKMAGKNKNHLMRWPSPWGEGFPGWHIECSAMSTKYLGDHFDIHCGGIDHIPVHHTNEIAQNDGAYGHQTVNFWMHNEFLIIGDGVKMAKSGENFLTLQSLKDKGYDPLAYRYLTLTAHYKKPLTFSWEALDGATNALENLYAQVREYDDDGKTVSAEFEQKFKDALADDLDTPKALAILWNLIKSDDASAIKKAAILEFDKVLGLGLKNPNSNTISTSSSSSTSSTTTLLIEEDKNLIAKRGELRKEKKWQEADEMRQKIEDLGYFLEDSENGTKIKINIRKFLLSHGFIEYPNRDIYVNKGNKTVVIREYFRWQADEKINLKEMVSDNDTDDIRWFDLGQLLDNTKGEIKKECQL